MAVSSLPTISQNPSNYHCTFSMWKLAWVRFAKKIRPLKRWQVVSVLKEGKIRREGKEGMAESRS